MDFEISFIKISLKVGKLRPFKEFNMADIEPPF